MVSEISGILLFRVVATRAKAEGSGLTSEHQLQPESLFQREGCDSSLWGIA